MFCEEAEAAAPASVWTGVSTAKSGLTLSVTSARAVSSRPQFSHLSHGAMVVSSGGGMCMKLC